MIWFVGVQLTRMAIAILLGYGGTCLLCKTVSLEALLRTTVALKCACACVRASVLCVRAGVRAGDVRVCLLACMCADVVLCICNVASYT